MDPRSLVDEMRTIERRYAGTLATDEQPADRIRARLREARAREPDIEAAYSIDDPWESTLLHALCRRYGLRPFRRPRQRSTTVMFVVPASFATDTLKPLFDALADALRNHLFRFTDAAFREAIYDDSAVPAGTPRATAPTRGESGLHLRPARRIEPGLTVPRRPGRGHDGVRRTATHIVSPLRFLEGMGRAQFAGRSAASRAGSVKA